MHPTDDWRLFFQNWPEDLPRRGVVVVSFGEQISFEGFAVSDAMVIVERKVPDTIGARKVVIPYSQIVALKFIDVVKTKSLAPLGFQEHSASKKA